MSFLERFFGIFWRDDASCGAPATPSGQALTPAAVRTVLIRWHEMIDAACGVSGYILRPLALRADAGISGGALIEALAGEGIARLAERRKAIVPVTPAQWRDADFARLAKPTIYFLVSAKDAPEPGLAALRELAAAIRAVGSPVAVDAAAYALNAGAGDFADLLLLGLEGASLADLEQQIRQAQANNPGLVVAVEGVSSWSEYRFLQSLGVALCVGSFVATFNDEEQVEKISQSRLVIIEMLKLLRQDGDSGDLAALAKRDPVVVLKLIEMANSPLSALSRRVSTLEEAIAVLGHDALYRWLALAMFRIDKGGDRDETIMLIALGRAAFLESLAAESDPHLAGELFLVGLFSLIDSLLQMPIEKILVNMYLPAAVIAVLLRREGIYARYLILAVEMEHGRLDNALSLCAALNIDSGKMLKGYRESRAWAANQA